MNVLIYIPIAFSVLIIAYIVTNSLVPAIIKFTEKKNMLDKPNWRSSHTTPTPSLGGLSFLPALFIPLVFIPISTEIAVLIIGSTIMSIIGFIDDRIDLGSLKKLAIQISIASLLFYGGFALNNLHGIFGIYELPLITSYALTLLVIVALMNAFNLIDGIDGLAGGVGVINCIAFGVIFLIQGNYGFALLCIALIGGLFGFLKFNFFPAKIFMGDTGSLLLGTCMSSFTIKSFSYGENEIIIIVMALVLLPSLDMLRLFIGRMLNGNSPFKADQNHYHHLLLKAGDSHRKASLTCYSITSLLIVSAWPIGLMSNLTESFLFMIGFGCIIYVISELKFYFNYGGKQETLEGKFKHLVKKNFLLQK